MVSQSARQEGDSRPSSSPVESGVETARAAGGCAAAAVPPGRPVRIEVGQDPLTQQPNRTRSTGTGVFEQRRLYLGGVLGAVRSGDRLYRLRPPPRAPTHPTAAKASAMAG